jgi:acetyltransferase-like isoleucine patch superfamily enzyme
VNNRLTTFHNFSNEPISLPENKYVVLERQAGIINSKVTGGLYLERNSMLNRVESSGPNGVGSFSYVTDSTLNSFISIGPRTTVGGVEHPLDWLSTHCFQWGQNKNYYGVSEELLANFDFFDKPKAKTTVIRSDVWIGANAVVISGVTMAVGSVLGAGSVLTKDTKPYGIYVGNPARLIRYRFSDSTILSLLASEWWKLPIEFLLRLNFQDIDGCIQEIALFSSKNSTK